MGFSHPWLLLFSPLALLERGRRRWVVFLLILGAAGPLLPLVPQITAVLVDQSPSAAPAASRLAAKSKLAHAKYFAFAERVRQMADPAARYSDLGAETRLQAALDAAYASGAARVLLISDGLWRGKPSSALPLYAVWAPPAAHLELEPLLAPALPRRGEVVEVQAVIDGTVSSDASITFATGGASKTFQRHLLRGRNYVPFRLRLTKAVTLTVKLRSAYGEGVRSITLRPLSAGNALVVGDAAAAAYLRAADWQVLEGEPKSLNAATDLLVIGNGVADWGKEGLARLSNYLRSGGAVLWTATPKGLFFGGWQKTSLAQKMPLAVDPQDGAALLIVLDTSASMRQGRPSKLDLAAEGVARLLAAASDADSLGLISFADQARWLLRLRPLDYHQRRQAEKLLADLRADGGTVMAPAYFAASRALEGSTAKTRWLLVISDGRIGDDKNPILQAAASAAKKGVKTLTLALGGDADRAFLSLLAQRGAGSYYDLADPSALPALLQTLGRRAFTNRSLTGLFPLIVRPHAVTQGISLSPARALTPARARGWAEVPLRTKNGRPVLALGQVGSARVAALASDLSISWKNDPDAALLLAQLARWLSNTAARPSYRWRRTAEGLQLLLQGRFEPLPLASYGGRQEALEPISPFEFVLNLPAAWREPVRISNGARTLFTAKPAPITEWPPLDGRAQLRALAARSGGALLASAAQLQPLPRRASAMGPYLWLAALALFFWDRYRESRVG